MRWFKLGLVICGLIFALYAGAMYFVPESSATTLEEKINYPLEKVYPQFSNLQNFTEWHPLFAGKKKPSVNFFEPYDGQGSSMNYKLPARGEAGEIFIRFAAPDKAIRYQVYRNGNRQPYQIDVKFKKNNATSTQISWTVYTPKKNFLERSKNLLDKGFLEGDFSAGIQALSAMLGKKVNHDQLLDKIKTDTIMEEKIPGGLLLGVSVSSKNTKGYFGKDLAMNHNKVANFVRTDLSKKDDEFGNAVLITDAISAKGKEISYFYGVELLKREGVSDNNFNYRTINPSTAVILYVKADPDEKYLSIQKIMQYAKKKELNFGDIYIYFLETPAENSPVLMKFVLPVH